MPLILLCLLVVILDQLFKFIVTRFLSPGESIPIIKNFFHITLVQNTGGAFGILRDETLIFLAVSITAILFIIYYLPRLEKTAHLARTSAVLILGGAAGNLIDRIRFGCVIDFLDFRVWPVFNIADSAITVGAILLVIKLLTKSQKSKFKSQN